MDLLPVLPLALVIAINLDPYLRAINSDRFQLASLESRLNLQSQIRPLNHWMVMLHSYYRLDRFYLEDSTLCLLISS